MKKSKLIFKVDCNNRGKIYINKKWLTDVTKVDIHGEPWNYTVEIERYKRNPDGSFSIKDGDIEEYSTVYRLRK